MVEEKWSGSFTVEAAVLVSAVLLLTYGVIMAVFYYHDKNILTGTAYETAVIAGRKQKKEPPFQKEEIQQLWKERISGKMILFRKTEVPVSAAFFSFLISRIFLSGSTSAAFASTVIFILFLDA